MFSERRSLYVGQHKPAFELAYEDAILSDEILVAQQQFLIDGARDVGEYSSPIPLCPPQVRVTLVRHCRRRRRVSGSVVNPGQFSRFEFFDHTGSLGRGIA